MKTEILVPSRGRPEGAARMCNSVLQNAQGDGVSVTFICDRDDPTLDDYLRRGLAVRVVERVGFTASLNILAAERWDHCDVLGAFGDDVVFQTPGWDRVLEDTLRTPGIAYGDDLIHGKNHPSAVFMSTAIAKALGWLALPATTHQWADDGWKLLGQSTGLLRFMPGVIVEHMHPGVGKAEWDATYEGVFEGERAKGDYEGFTAWAESGLAADVAKVLAV